MLIGVHNNELLYDIFLNVCHCALFIRAPHYSLLSIILLVPLLPLNSLSWVLVSHMLVNLDLTYKRKCT